MAKKGVKKIKWVREPGKVDKSKSVENNVLVINPDVTVYFEVGEWFPGTTEQNKFEGVVWILQENKWKTVIYQTPRIAVDWKYPLLIPKKLCGVYFYYLEASMSGNRDISNPVGLLIRGYTEPRIVDSGWSKELYGTDVRKTYQFSYGEALYLNLQTEGLNGLKNLKVEVYRRVKKGGGVTDDQLI